MYNVVVYAIARQETEDVGTTINKGK